MSPVVLPSNPRRTYRLPAAPLDRLAAGSYVKPNIPVPRTDTTVALKIGVVVLEPSDVGHRVVIRHRTERGPTDLLGELVSLDAQRLVIRTERGEEREIARAAV